MNAGGGVVNNWAFINVRRRLLHCLKGWLGMSSSSVPDKGNWKKPEGKPSGKLRVYNSLTRSKVSFGSLCWEGDCYN